MSLKIIRSGSSLDDLVAIWDYLAKHSVGSADKVVARINDRIHQLADFPKSGEAQPQFGNQCRRVIVGNYLVFYDLYSDQIEVLRVLHAAREIEDLTTSE